MTQHTSNNRNPNIPNTINSGIQYSHKTRTRASRARVGAVRKPSFSEKQLRSCPRCKESANSVKMLTARVGRIEYLVNALAKTTHGLTSISKREDRFSQRNLRIGEIDLTNCSLQELQKLVVATTNIMVPPKKFFPRLPTPTSPVPVNDTIMTDAKPILYSEPKSEENVDEEIQEKESEQNHHQRPATPTSPVKTATSTLKRNKSLRQDSGFEESKHLSPSDGTQK